MTIGEVAQMLTALAAVGSCFVSLRNGRKLTEVHKQTNSIAMRNETMAKEAGILEGKAAEKANPS